MPVTLHRPRVLVACECSGRVRDALLLVGVDAVSCDYLKSEKPGPHLEDDCRDHLDPEKYDALIAFPPCTYLCRSGIHWNGRIPGRDESTRQALEFFATLYHAPFRYVALENPVNIVPKRLGIPVTQWIQPYQFGHDANKKTGLWLRGFPPLRIDPRWEHPGRLINGKRRYANQTASGQNNVSGCRRARERSRTYSHIATQMGQQWGAFLWEVLNPC